MKNLSRLSILMLILFYSCNQGLEPIKEEDKLEIRGLITFVNGKDNFPPIDSLKDLRVAFFQEYPDSANILNDFISGNLIFTDDTLNYNVDTASYSKILETPPVSFKYICVVQNYGGLLDWKVVGLYTDDTVNYTPKTLFIDKKNGELNKVNINVNFKNPPPQPF